jgi:hypothetical protein
MLVREVPADLGRSNALLKMKNSLKKIGGRWWWGFVVDRLKNQTGGERGIRTPGRAFDPTTV